MKQPAARSQQARQAGEHAMELTTATLSAWACAGERSRPKNGTAPIEGAMVSGRGVF
jgi:hypothetical protein